MTEDLQQKWPLGQSPNILYPIPSQMESLTIQRDDYGQPADVIRIEDVPVPRLNPEDANSVLVAILATGPNFNTNFAALGLPIPVFGRRDSATIHIPGSDAIGIVVDAGSAVKELKVGETVILDSWTDQAIIRGYETHDGFHAQFAMVDKARAIPVPANLKAQSPLQLAAMMLTYGTAYRAVVERLSVYPGDSILLMGGGKGTSFAGAQIAKELGARVILMGSNPALANSLIERGIADAFVDRRRIPKDVYGVLQIDESYDQWFQRTMPFREAVYASNGGKPVDKIFEHTGGANFPLLVSTLAENGALAFFGATGSGLKGEYKETFYYDSRRFVMDARWMWMRQKQLIFRKASPAQIFAEIGLLPGKRGLIWGADSYAREFAEAALARSANLVILASFSEESEGIKKLQKLGVRPANIIDRDNFDLSTDMPDPLTGAGTPNSDYAKQYMPAARAIGRAIRQVFGPRISPDFIVERVDQSTLHYSSFLLRDYSEREDSATGFIVVRGNRNLSIFGSHMYRSSQAREVVRLLAQKKIVMEKDDLEVCSLKDLPAIQQKMLDGTLIKPKGVARVQAGQEDLSIGALEKAFMGERIQKTDLKNKKYLDIHLLADIGMLVLKRTDALNALNNDLLTQLADIIREIKDHNTLKGQPVRALIICSGARAFVAGADVKEFQGNSAEEIATIAAHNISVFSAIENLDVPVISLIDGIALGGGNELAMSTHYRIATENARLGQPEIKLGIVPGYGGLQRLPRLVGPRLAAELCVNGEAIDARTAMNAGLVDEFAVPSRALKRAVEVAQEFTSGKRPLIKKAWDDISAEQNAELSELFEAREVSALTEAPAPDEDESKIILAARKYAARFVLEAMRYGYRNGIKAGLENDAHLFGEVAASLSGQEWIGRFIKKDPKQSAIISLLTPQND
ncbi:MAG: zinc-binding dehydrogenase [bacterium]|nr:zinc-binding dehydrogenase [bacterium]